MASSKVDEVCSLFLQCSHSEQLELLTKLANLICRDFIGRLPNLVVFCILQYLPIVDVISCMRVSRHWFTIIKECHYYWKWICRKRGIDTTNVINHAFMDLGLKAERHFAKINLALSKSKFRMRNMLTKAIRPMIYEDPYGGIVISAWDILTHNSSIYLHDLHSNEIFIDKALSGLRRPIVWASSTLKDCIVFASDSADWGVTNYHKNQTRFWTDNKVVTPSRAKFSVCKTCLLTVEIEQQPCTRSPTLSWNIEFIRFLPTEQDNVQRIITHISIENMNATENDYVSVQSVALVPCHADGDGMFKEHYLLVQLGCGVFIFMYNSETRDMSKSIKKFCPSGTVQCLKSLGNDFKLSQDNSLFAFVQLSKLYIWNLKEGTCVSVIELKSHYNLLVVGSLYILLQLNNSNSSNESKCIMISTCYGTPVYSFTLAGKRDYFAPVDRNWLSSLDAFKKSGNTMIIPCSYNTLLKCLYF